MVDELGMLLEAGEGRCVHVSMDRLDPANFTDAEVQRLRDYEPLIAAAVRAEWMHAPRADGPRGAGFNERLSVVFDNFGSTELTPRESEIVRLLLRGYSAKATAGLLGISTGTVMNHRRSIYAKLRIRSQAELFNLFLEALSSADANRVEPPARRPVKPRQRKRVAAS
jgi:DNA-binding CsgD family transcriptional regulator